MSRVPLVALHGFMGTPDTFRMVSVTPGHPVLALPLPEPDPVPAPKVRLSAFHDHVARRLLQTLDTQDVSRFHLLGYSLGGRIALHMAHLAPERIDSLILESTNPGLERLDECEARCQHDAAWAHRIRREWPDVLHDWYEQPVFASLSPPLKRELIAEKKGQDPERMARMLERLSLGRQHAFWEDLSRAVFPILFVSGEMDDRYRAIGERLAAHPGPIRHCSIPGAGHVVHREQPEAYLAVLQSFLNP
jgi:2-succinyl-6-hydroxy-2,4-cyclohexadiene-1-carboxylate synthase